MHVDCLFQTTDFGRLDHQQSPTIDNYFQTILFLHFNHINETRNERPQHRT